MTGVQTCALPILAARHGIQVINHYMQPEDFPHNLNLWAHPSDDELMAAVHELENPANLPALVHCSHGKDRTGLVAAVYSVRNKRYCRCTAVRQMVYFGTNGLLQGLVPMVENVPEAALCVGAFDGEAR